MQGTNQATEVLQYLKRHGSITPSEAIKRLGCYRLAARVHELRNDGYTISTTLEKTHKRSGRYAKYRLYSQGKKLSNTPRR